MKWGRAEGWRHISPHLTEQTTEAAVRDCEMKEWYYNSALPPSSFQSGHFYTYTYLLIMNGSHQWHISVQIRDQNTDGGNRRPRIQLGPERWSLHMEHISNNTASLNAAVSSDRAHCGKSFKTLPHYATLMQENIWSLSFTWLHVSGIKDSVEIIGIITRLFQAGGAIRLGCSKKW